MLGGEIKVLLTLDNGQFTIQTQKAGQTISELKRSLDQTAQSSQALEKHFTGLGQKFHDVVRTASLMRFAIQDVHDIFLSLPTAVLKSSGEMERMTLLMKGMSKEATEAGKQLDAVKNTKFVFDMAQKNPFDVKTLTDSFVKLKSAGIDPTNGSLQSLTDSVAKFGGTSETMHRASIAIQQMAGKGVISMEELRQQLGEAVPNAINLMAQGSGVSLQKFAALVKTGTVGATTSLQNMFTVMRYENEGAAAAMMDSWTGMLSLLSTKFELWKVEVGKGSFFKEAKDQLQAVIDLFGTNEAKKFANQLGEDLATVVRALRVVVEFTIKWWDTIKLAGEAYLAYFAANKILAFGEAFKRSIMERVGLYSREIAEQEKAKADKLRIITEEIAALEAAFIKKQTMLAQETEANNAAAAKQAQAEVTKMEKQRASLATQLADRVAHYQQLTALQQTFLMQQMAAEVEAEAQLRRKKAGSAAAAAAANAEAMRIANNASVLSGTVAATQAEIAALKQKEAALLASIAATRAHTVAQSADAAAAALTADFFRNNARLLNEKAAASGAAALSVGMLGRAMTGLKLVFDAFGGWVGVAIGVLFTLGDMLWKYMNRWEEFRKIVERTKNGIYSKEDLEGAQAREKELDEKIKTKEAVLARLEAEQDPRRAQYNAKQAGFRDASGIGDVEAYKAALRKQIADQRVALEEATAQRMEQTKLGQEKASTESLNIYRREYDREAAEKQRIFREGTTASIAAEEKAVKAAQDAALARGAKLTGPAEDAVRAPYIAQRNTIIKESNRATLDFALLKAAEVDAKIKIETDQEKRRALETQKVFLDEQVKTARMQNTQAATLGTLDVRGKEANDKPIDPLLRYVTTLANNLDKAKLKLEASIEGVRDAAALRNEAAVQVLGDMAEGRFDKSLEKNDDGTTKKDYVGGAEARKTAVADFLKLLKEGKGDVDQFVNGLTGLNDAQKKLILSGIDYAAQLPMVKEQQRALTDAARQEVKTLEDLTAARSLYASDGLAKESAGMVSLQKHFSELSKSVAKAGSDFEEFQRKKAAAFANQAMTDATTFGSDAQKALRDATLAQVKATQTVSEAREYEHRENLRRIEAEREALNASLMQQMGAEKLSDDKKAELVAALNQLEIDSAKKVAAENKRKDTESLTAMDNLRKTWADSGLAMQQVSASWATSFMDNVINVVSGTKVNWRGMVASMAKDLLSVVMKESFGKQVAGMFQGLSGTLTTAVGLGGPKAGGNDAAAAATAAMTNLTQTTAQTSEAMTDFSLGGLAKMASSIWASITNMIFGTTVEQTKTATSVTQTASMVTLTAAANAAAFALARVAMTGGGGIGGIFGAGGGAEAGVQDSTATMLETATYAANGAVMTGLGPVSLNKYANGGIARTPQMAIFGEGSVPEAYVPLPDGRTIPVTMSGNGGGGAPNVTINIVVNKDGGTETSASDGANPWTEMAAKVKDVVRNELVTQSRPGGLLYK